MGYVMRILCISAKEVLTRMTRKQKDLLGKPINGAQIMVDLLEESVKTKFMILFFTLLDKTRNINELK